MASESATAIWVPSMATTSRPANRVTCRAPVTPGPLRRQNSSRSGAGPTRRMAWHSDEADGVRTGTGSPVTRREKTCFHPWSANKPPASNR
nr:hypothetical protein [Specibacter cremeus]